MTLKFIERGKRARIANTVLKEQIKVGELTYLTSRLTTAVVIKIVSYWWKNRQIDQWNRIEYPERDPHKYRHLIFDKEAKAIQWSKDSLFKKWCWNSIWYMSTYKKMNLGTDLILSEKLTKWTIDLNLEHKTIKFLEDSRRKPRWPWVWWCLFRYNSKGTIH